MPKFFHLILCVFIFSLLQACVNTSHYFPAERSGFGYSEEKIDQEQYRVQFSLRGDNISLAKEHALLRAAELTLAEGYFWFTVSESTASVNHDNKMDPSQITPVSQSSSLGNLDLAGVGTGEDHIALRGSTLDLGNTTSMAIATIEIHMFMEEKQKRKNVYSAQETYQILRSKLVIENTRGYSSL